MRRILRTLLSALCLCASACASSEVTPRTQVLLQVVVGGQIKSEADSLVIYLSREGNERGALEERFELDGDFAWPASIALLPKNASADASFRVEAIAYDGTRKLAVGRVISQFLEGKTLLLVLELPDACLGQLDCNPDETCSAQVGKARCVSARVDAKQLKQITDPRQLDREMQDASQMSLPDASADVSDAGEDAADTPSEAGAEEDAADAASAEDADGGALPDADDAADASDGGDAADSDAGDEGGVVCNATEDCLNGVDDDCDGHPDCDDSECSPVTLCVPDQPASVGLRVPVGQPCPPGYAGSRKDLHRALTGGGCGGCGCGAAGATTCTANLLAYTSSANCTIGTPAVTATLSSFTCTQNPVFSGSYYGLAVGSISATPGVCPASGTAKPGTPQWGEDSALCTLSKRGTGCATGMVCAPKPSAGRVCVESASASCGVEQTAELWYTSYEDTRACSACTCTASGASCAGVTVHYGNDWSCNSAHVLGASQKYCGSVYSPPAGLVGTPVNAACTPSSQLSGSLQPRGNTSLCCY